MQKCTTKSLLQTAWTVLAVSLYPLCFQWLNNIEDSQMQQVCLGILYSMLIGFVLWAGLWLLYKDLFISAFGSIVILIIFWNYNLFNLVVKFVYSKAYYWHTVIIMLTLIAIVMQVLFLLRDKLSFATANTVVGSAFLLLIIFNMFPGINELMKLQNSRVINEHGESVLNIQTDAVANNLPNVHIFVFDEFSSDNFMLKYYNHDNTLFREMLQSKSFDYSMSSRYKLAGTMYGLPSLMNMEYPKEMSLELLNKSLTDSKVFDVFSKFGYETRSFCEENEELLNDFNKILFDKTMIGSLLSENRNYDEWAKRNKLFTEEVINRDYSKSENPILTFTFFNLPHSPYLFTATGERLPDNKVLDYINPSPYYGQYLYTQTIIKQIVDNVIADDADSIIVLTSDHSMRFMYTYHDDTYPDYGEILNAVYYRGQKLPFTLEGLDGANTMRCIANSVLGLELELLEETNG